MIQIVRIFLIFISKKKGKKKQYKQMFHFYFLTGIKRNQTEDNYPIANQNPVRICPLSRAIIRQCHTEIHFQENMKTLLQSQIPDIRTSLL